MFHLRGRRRAAAGAVALLALAGLPAATAHAGTYKHVVCASPATGQGVIADGQLPDGMSNPTHYATMGSGATLAACTSGRGIPVPLLATTNQPNTGAALVYRAGDGIAFRGATLYRQFTKSTSWSLFEHRGEFWQHPYASPWDFRCDVRCAGLGGDVPFSELNRVSFGPATETTNGFNMSVLCEIPDTSRWCSSDSARGLRLYGGVVTLEDTANPAIAGQPGGSLLEDPVLVGGEELTVNATDGGAGVYRTRVLLDNAVRLTRVIDDNGGRCRALPGEDAYVFAVRRPCKPMAGGNYEFDTRELPDGRANLKVQVEDAAGNTTTMVNRTVTIDNIPAPSVVSDPRVEGSARRGSSLALTPAAWDDHGAAGEPTVTRVWQRCRRDGSACEDVPGRTGLTYLLGDADLNRRIRAIEVAANSEGSRQAATALSPVVVREDGTLPADNNDQDDDGDGQVDEPGETAPGTGGGGGGGGSTDAPSSGGATLMGPKGPDGARGAAGAPGVTGAVASAGAVNGEGASPHARLTVAFATGGSRAKLRYGRTVAVRGTLVDEAGRPIRNAIIDVAETPAVAGARRAAGRPAVTGADGSFSYAATSRPGTRSISFVYRYQREGAVVSEASVRLAVRAGVRLSVSLRGIVVSYRGKVLAGAIPKGGKLVIVQGRAKGAGWQTFASRRARKAGAFKGQYRLKVRRPGARLQFRVRVLGEAGWNYGAVTSRAVTRTVR